MITFIKAQAASLVASLIDFLITIFCVQVLGLWYVLGSILGTVTGGVVNFTMGRVWVFNADENDPRTQALRYILVWCGYLLLITGGIYLFTHYFAINYVLSKILMTGVFGIPYNYLLQKKYIFVKK